MTDRLAEQTTRLLKMNEVVFVAQQIDDDGNDFAWQVANAESSSSSIHCIEFVLLFGPDYK